MMAGPTMLLPIDVVRVPGLDQRQLLVQIIYVPVLYGLLSVVAFYPGSNSSRTEGATDVDVVTASQADFPQSPDGRGVGARAMKDKCVGTGLRFQ